MVLCLLYRFGLGFVGLLELRLVVGLICGYWWFDVVFVSFGYLVLMLLVYDFVVRCLLIVLLFTFLLSLELALVCVCWVRLWWLFDCC